MYHWLKLNPVVKKLDIIIHIAKSKGTKEDFDKQAVQNDAQRRLSKNRSKALQKKKEKALVLFQKKEALKKIF